MASGAVHALSFRRRFSRAASSRRIPATTTTTQPAKRATIAVTANTIQSAAGITFSRVSNFAS
jgi:hypothetical protein